MMYRARLHNMIMYVTLVFGVFRVRRWYTEVSSEQFTVELSMSVYFPKYVES